MPGHSEILSYFTPQETLLLLNTTQEFNRNEAHHETEEIRQAANHLVEQLAVRLRQVECLTPFKSACITPGFKKANIRVKPLVFLSDKIPDIIKSTMNDGTTNDAFSINQTRDRLRSIQTHLLVHTEAEQLCREFITTILTHVVSNLNNDEFCVGIVLDYEFKLSEDGTSSHKYPATSYGNVVDYMLAKDKPRSVSEYGHVIFSCGIFIDNAIVEGLSSNIYMAEMDWVNVAVPDAVMAAVTFCRQYNRTTYRSCVTDGKTWVFFVFDADASGEGGSVGVSKSFRLDRDLSRLPVLLGLLRDWVMNAQERNQQFFSYYED